MNNNNILKFLVPVVAIIVLSESVMIISNLRNKNVEVPPVVETKTVVETPEKPMVDSVYKINLTTDLTTLKTNATGKVEVEMVGNSERALDSINIYVKYDPEMVDVSSLSFDKKLPVPAFNKISTTRGLVVANFLVSEASGLKLKSGESLSLMSFNVKPKKVGNLDFEISTGSELKESATMIVENATSKVLPFSSNKLTINATL